MNISEHFMRGIISFNFCSLPFAKKIRRGLYKILNILHKRGFEGGKQSIKLSEEFDRISPITA